jgi:hypothetical protein
MASAQAKTTRQVIPRLTSSAPKPRYRDGQAAQALRALTERDGSVCSSRAIGRCLTRRACVACRGRRRCVPRSGHRGGVGAGEEPGGGQLGVEGVAGDEFCVGSGPPGSPTPTSTPWPPTMPRGGVSAVAFGTTASGQLLLATAGKNRKVRLWDPISKLNVATLRRRCNTRAIAIAAPPLAIGDDEGLSVVEPSIDGWPRQKTCEAMLRSRSPLIRQPYLGPAQLRRTCLSPRRLPSAERPFRSPLSLC